MYFGNYFVGKKFCAKKFSRLKPYREILHFEGIHFRGRDNSLNFTGINFRGYGYVKKEVEKIFLFKKICCDDYEENLSVLENKVISVITIMY